MADEPKRPDGSIELKQAAARLARSRAKRDHLTQILEGGVRAMVHLDARRTGVQVPLQHSRDSELRLNLSYKFAESRMNLNERGIEATLKFGGTPFRVVLPWTSIWAIGPSDAPTGPRVWEADLPIEASGPPVPAIEDEAAKQDSPTRWTPRLVTPHDVPSLDNEEVTAVEKPPQTPPESAEKIEPEEPPPPRPRLRLVE